MVSKTKTQKTDSQTIEVNEVMLHGKAYCPNKEQDANGEYKCAGRRNNDGKAFKLFAKSAIVPVGKAVFPNSVKCPYCGAIQTVKVQTTAQRDADEAYWKQRMTQNKN